MVAGFTLAGGVPVATSGGVVEAGALLDAEDEFPLFGFPEFVRSGDGFCGAASLELEAEELTDFEVADAAVAPRRAASWSPQPGLPWELFYDPLGAN